MWLKKKKNLKQYDIFLDFLKKLIWVPKDSNFQTLLSGFTGLKSHMTETHLHDTRKQLHTFCTFQLVSKNVAQCVWLFCTCMEDLSHFLICSGRLCIICPVAIWKTYCAPCYIKSEIKTRGKLSFIQHHDVNLGTFRLEWKAKITLVLSTWLTMFNYYLIFNRSEWKIMKTSVTCVHVVNHQDTSCSRSSSTVV